MRLSLVKGCVQFVDEHLNISAVLVCNRDELLGDDALDVRIVHIESVTQGLQDPRRAVLPVFPGNTRWYVTQAIHYQGADIQVDLFFGFAVNVRT